MDQLTFKETTDKLISDLEVTLGKLSLAAEAKISTSPFEEKAKKLAAKLKQLAFLVNIPVYKDVKASQFYNWNYDQVPSDQFASFTVLCKNIKEELGLYKSNETQTYYAQLSEGLFISLVDLPKVELPSFKIKIQDNTLMAVRADMLEKLPSSIVKLLTNQTEEER